MNQRQRERAVAAPDQRPGDIVLEARQVTKTYPSRSGGGDVHALIDVDMAVVKGRRSGSSASRAAARRR